MFVGRSSAWRLGLLALLGTASLSLGACGLLIGLEDHQAFPGGDAGADGGDQPDADHDDAMADAPGDVTIDGCTGTACAGMCVDTLADPKNCGQCGVVCGNGYACDVGVCGDHIEQISAGSNHGCQLLHDGTIWCWGNDSSGQLGVPPEKDLKCPSGAACSPTPIQVEGLPKNKKMISVSAGADFTCAIDVDGTVWCWGADDTLQLGRIATTGTFDRAPGKVPIPAAVDKVSTGYSFACARLADHTKIMCWGSNASGALGGGKMPSPNGGFDPGDVVLMPPDVRDVTTGLGDHACALTSLNKVWCWGSNNLGQLGHSSMMDTSLCPMKKCNSTPTEIANLTVPGATLSASVEGTCALGSAGFVCWGSNVFGLLGTTVDPVEHSTPTTVVLGADALPASAQGSYLATCLQTTNGDLDCWGDDSFGALGRGKLATGGCAGGGFCDPKAARVGLPVNVKAMKFATGAHWAMALTDKNQIYAWGANDDGRIGHMPGDFVDQADCGYGGKDMCNPTPALIPAVGATP
jgi:alpha-tubulin suppressor-like RCC1 family protein